MDLDQISASNIINAVKSYRLPVSEPIFSFEINNKSQNIQWLNVARPTDLAHYTIPTFWAASLYNSFENHFIRESFEAVGDSSIWELIEIDMALKEITDLLKDNKSVYLKVEALKICYSVLNTECFRGIVGFDNQGLFSIVWKYNRTK